MNEQETGSDRDQLAEPQPSIEWDYAPSPRMVRLAVTAGGRIQQVERRGETSMVSYALALLVISVMVIVIAGVIGQQLGNVFSLVSRAL
ncbi:MAG TPA: hypothetical protein VEK76_13585 [Candidatus Binatia bacterium]|nr:hypothetical protein [Candidatus Binatia bacterium]